MLKLEEGKSTQQRLNIYYVQRHGLPLWLSWETTACVAGDLGSIPGLGRSPGEGKGYPLQYSGLDISMDSIVHGAAKSQTQLSSLEKKEEGMVLSTQCVVVSFNS